MEEQNFSKEGGKFVPDVLASVQPILTSCSGVLGSRMNMALVPHSCSDFSSSLRFTLPPSPSPLVPSQLLSLPGRSKQAPACLSAHIPPAVGLAEKGAIPAHLGEVLGIPRERGLIQKLKLAACCDD